MGVIMEDQKHIHSFEDTVVPATCTQQGYTLHRCACGYEHKDSFVLVGAHTFQAAEETEATCTKPGQQQLKCTCCGAIQTREVPALGHSWGQWNVQTFVTCTEDGVQFRSCSRCGATEEQTVKAKGHTLTNPKKSATEKGIVEYFCPDCGETIQKKTGIRKHKKLIVWVSVLLSVVILLGGLLALLPTIMGRQAYSYYAAKCMIAIGRYEKAYYLLQDCVESKYSPANYGYTYDYYKDTEDLLSDFYLLCEEYTRYDEDGKLTEKEEETCDKEMGRITSITTNAEGDITEKYIREYEDGNQIRYLHIEYDDDGKVSDHFESESEYDKDGNQTSRVYYDADGTVKSSYKYKYDKHGNLTSEVCYNATGEKIREGKYKVIYLPKLGK